MPQRATPQILTVTVSHVQAVQDRAKVAQTFRIPGKALESRSVLLGKFSIPKNPAEQIPLKLSTVQIRQRTTPLLYGTTWLSW